MRRVVGTLTTIPPKYVNCNKLLDSLKSLNNQTYKLDKIYLTLPYRCERLNIDYPDVSEEIKSLCTIVRCHDYGPITKLMGALMMEDEDVVIFSCDDDMIYHKNTVEKLMEKINLYPNCAIGSTGFLLKNTFPNCSYYNNMNFFGHNLINFNVNKNGRYVDSLFGFSGILYFRRFFPKKDNLYEDFIKLSLSHDDLKSNDDIYISGWLSSKKIKRIVFNDIPKIDFSTINRQKTDISADNIKFVKKLNSSILISKSIGFYKTVEPIYYYETITFKTILLISIILIIIILIYNYNYINYLYIQGFPSFNI
jgi:hypothetical protein